MSTQSASKPEPAGLNPFFHVGAPIRDAAYFFGRRRELSYLFDLLRAGQSVSIFGQRRLGKTSLLFHAATAAVSAAHGLPQEKNRWVYLDGGLLDGLEEDSLYAALERGLGGELSAVPYTRLEDRVRGLAAAGLRLIVAVDEFELLAQNGHLQPRFFNRLRGLATQFPVQFVIASKQPLGRIAFANPDVIGSHFFNFFAPFRISVFERDEAVAMLRELSARGRREFDAATVAFLVELVGTHPQFLQVAAFHAFELVKKGALTDQARARVRKQVLDQLDQHLEYYWRDLSSDERYALASLPLAPQDSSSPEYARLEETGFVVEGRYLGRIVAEFLEGHSADGIIRRGAFLMDERRLLLAVDGQPLHLTPTEFSALRFLMRSSGKVVTPQEIEAFLWPGDLAPDPKRARGVIKKLRAGLGPAGEAITTHRGQGFSLK